MPKLTQKQENFVQAYVRSSNGYQAYLEAYDVSPNTARSTVDQSASRLLSNPKIAARLAEINDQATERVAEQRIADAEQAGYDVEAVASMLKNAYDKAAEDPKGGAAMVAAAMGLARLHGLIINKSEDVTQRESSRSVDARIRQLLAGVQEDRASRSAGEAGSGVQPREAVPTVSDVGTA